MTWLFNAHKQRDCRANETTVHGITITCHSAAAQLSGPYLTKVIILSHFLCIRSWSNGGMECLGVGGRVRGGRVSPL